MMARFPDKWKFFPKWYKPLEIWKKIPPNQKLKILTIHNSIIVWTTKKEIQEMFENNSKLIYRGVALGFRSYILKGLKLRKMEIG